MIDDRVTEALPPESCAAATFVHIQLWAPDASADRTRVQPAGVWALTALEFAPRKSSRRSPALTLDGTATECVVRFPFEDAAPTKDTSEAGTAATWTS